MQADANKEGKDVILEMGNIEDILVDSKDIRQVILNLSRNGLEAMEKGGALELTTSMEGNNVVLEVKDSGRGIPEEILNNLGTPFKQPRNTAPVWGYSSALKSWNHTRRRWR